MRLYLDACCLQRPFDDQTQPRIRVESEAVLAILAAVEAQDATLLSSEALEYELNRIPDFQRQSESTAMLSLAAERLLITDVVEGVATALELVGLTPLDALHAALASEALADLFITADDRLLKKLRTITGLKCLPVSLLAAVSEVTK